MTNYYSFPKSWDESTVIEKYISTAAPAEGHPRMSSTDIEKAHGSPSTNTTDHFDLDKTESTSSSEASDLVKPIPSPAPQSKWQRCLAGLTSGENGGIVRIHPEEREPVTSSTTLHMFLMWFSMTLATNNIVVGSMGTLVLGLSFKDAALCGIFGCLIGTSVIGYISTYGPKSGIRTLVGPVTDG